MYVYIYMNNSVVLFIRNNIGKFTNTCYFTHLKTNP